MTPTAYGYLVPDDGDLSKGASGWMAAEEFNWTRISAHTHNGTDSALLSSLTFASSTVVAAAGSWAANTDGSGSPAGGYKQTVTVPAGITELNSYNPKFYFSSAGNKQYQQVFLDYKRSTGTTFVLYCNDNTVDVTCVFR